MSDVAMRSSAARRVVEYRGGGFVAMPKPIYSWLVFTALLAFWQLSVSGGWINPVFLPSPASIGIAVWELILSGDFSKHLTASLGRIASGWLWGTGLGVVAGVAMGLLSVLRAVGIPLVSVLYPIPKIAILPLLILWMGIGEAPKVVTIASGVFFPTTIATLAGVDAVPRNLIRMAQSFNLPMWSILTKIILPSALPSILAGFRISISTALILVVAAEMIGAQFGVGAFLLTAGNLMQSDELMAGVVILSVLGLAFGSILTVIERVFLAWR